MEKPIVSKATLGDFLNILIILKALLQNTFQQQPLQMLFPWERCL